MAAKTDIESVLQSLTVEEKVGNPFKKTGTNVSYLAERILYELNRLPFSAAADFGRQLQSRKRESLISRFVVSLQILQISSQHTTERLRDETPSSTHTNTQRQTADGPNGVRGADFRGPSRSACFPAACSIAATFDPSIARRIGRALAEEALSKGARCLLGPTVCNHRHPLGGRNFESFSEDPLLAGRLAVQTVVGMQELGVAATVKHFVANEQETDRMSVDERIGARALREIYLRPFEIVIKEARPLAVMTAYNMVNGEHCDSNAWLLGTVLRGQWGWDGLVMSDWGGTNSLSGTINAGLDLEMPGPARVRTKGAVVAAIKGGEVSEEAVDDRARNVLQFLDRLGAFGLPEPEEERNVENTEHRKLIRDASAKGIVLLKNENGVLPLSKDKVRGKKIALIGYAKEALVQGGGSAAVNAYYKVTPWEGMRAALGDEVELTYAKGAFTRRLLVPLSNDSGCGRVVGLDGQPGFSRLLFELDNPTTPVSTQHGVEASTYSTLGSNESQWKIMELAADFTPEETGAHYLACSGIGPTEVIIDGEVVFSQDTNWHDPMGALFQAVTEEEFKHFFQAGRTYRLCVRSRPPTNVGLRILEGRTSMRMGFCAASEHDYDYLGEATRVASEADYAVVFTGHDPQWETEGRDQESFHLPRGGTQDALVTAVSRANASTVVVNSTGVAVAMPWLEQVPALLQAWFGGQECGNAIADVLTGAINPEGHLPVTFPRRIEDCSAYGNFPGTYVDGLLKADYAEGVFVGYRHFDRLPQDGVNFPFGHGLSYTSFKLGQPQVERQSRDTFSVTVTVSNTGVVFGGTALQVYVGSSVPTEENPIKILVAFQKVRFHPGEEQRIQLPVAVRDFARFDEGKHEWVVPNGEYTVRLGFSAAETSESVTFKLKDDVKYAP